MYKHLLWTFGFILLGASPVFNQSFYANYDPSPGNQVYFGGFQEILPSPDGGFIALAGPYEKVLAKFDSQMDLVWAKKFNLPGAQLDYALTDLALTADDKVLVMGYFNGLGQNLSIVAKLDLDGTLIWKKDVESHYLSCGFHLLGSELLPTADNGFYMFGSTSHERSMVIRMDANGDALWAKILIDWDDTFSQRFQTGAFVSANSLMVLSNMSTISWIKMDDNGNILSQKLHELGMINTSPSMMLQAANGDLYTYGLTFDTLTWVMSHQMVRFNSSGDLIWAKKIEAPSGFKMEEPHAFLQMPNGELVVMGCLSFVGASGRRLMVSRFDLAGNHLATSLGWDGGYERIYGGMQWNGSLYLAGISLVNRNMIARLDADGSGFCNADSTALVVSDMTAGFYPSPDSVTVEVMPTTITNANWDLSPYTYTRSVLCGNPILDTPAPREAAWAIAPQPSNGQFDLHHPTMGSGSWKIYDLRGGLVGEGALSPHSSMTRIAMDGLHPGLYIMDLLGDGLRHSLRVVVE